jgi:carboxyl-terminal processing protease
VDMLSQLFDEKDKLLVYTAGRMVNKKEHKTTGRNRFNFKNIAILIDEGSASASEIVAGSIQDWDKGIVIGRRSFGKGLVQEQYPLSDSAALRLTVARYYMPSKRSIQKPYKNRDRKEYQGDSESRMKSGELFFADSTHFSDTTSYYTAAGRKVRGSSGIMPDYFIPIEPIEKNEYYHKLLIFIKDWSYNYANKHKQDLHFNQAEFIKGFRLNDAAYLDFINYTDRKGLKKDKNQVGDVKNRIKLMIKARLAKQQFGEEAYFAILNENDACFNKALSLFKVEDPLGLAKIPFKRK